MVTREGLGKRLASVKEPSWLAPFQITLPCLLGLGSGFAFLTTLQQESFADEGPRNIIISMGLVSFFSFLCAISGVVYLVRHRGDCTEAFENGFCQVRCGIESIYRWDDVLYCTTFVASVQGNQVDYLQVGLKNGKKFLLSLSNGLKRCEVAEAALNLDLIKYLFLKMTRNERTQRMQKDLSDRGYFECGKLKLSCDGVSVEQRKIDWANLLKINQLTIVLNVNGMKSNGHPVLRIYHRDKPTLPYLTVNMCDVHNSDIVLPLIESMIPSK